MYFFLYQMRFCSKLLLTSNVWTVKYVWPSILHINAKLNFLLIPVNLLFWKLTPVCLQRPAEKVLCKNIWINVCITTSWNIIGKRLMNKNKSEKGMLGEYQFRKDRKGIEKVLWSFAAVLSSRFCIKWSACDMQGDVEMAVKWCARMCVPALCLRASLEREWWLIGW